MLRHAQIICFWAGPPGWSPQSTGTTYEIDTTITRSVKELSNPRGNMAALVFGQARSARLGTVRPLSHSLGKAGLFADQVPAYTSRRQSISRIEFPRSQLRKM